MADFPDRIFLCENGTYEDARWLTVETTQRGRCVVDLTGMREPGDDQEYRLPCKVRALRDVVDGRLRHLHDDAAYGTFERVGEFIQISFHRSQPTVVTVKANEFENLVKRLEDEGGENADLSRDEA